MKHNKDQAFYIKMLDTEECLCGRTKKLRNTFCYLCFKELPHELQKALYQRMGDGYEQAVDEACQHLQQEFW